MESPITSFLAKPFDEWPRHPRLKAHLQLETLDEHSLALVSQGKTRMMRGRLYRVILPLLKKGLARDALITRLADRVTPAEILWVLRSLDRKGYLVDGPPPESRAEAWWEAYSEKQTLPAGRLADARVAITDLTGENLSPTLNQALADMDIVSADRGEVWVVPVANYLDHRLATINREALATVTPWLPVMPFGRTLTIGPWFIPGETGCWDCLALRLKGHRPIETFLQSHRPTPLPDSHAEPFLPATLKLAINLTALHLAHFLSVGREVPLAGSVLRFDPLGGCVGRHRLMRRPQCEACGHPRRYRKAAMAPLDLHAGAEKSQQSQSSAASQPKQILARLAQHVDPLLGAVAFLKPIMGEDGGPVFLVDAGPNPAIQCIDTNLLHNRFSERSFGKGRNLDEARAGALCEGLERYSGVFQGYEPYLEGSLLQLGDQAIHPNTCMGFSENQYRSRPSASPEPGLFQVPQPFQENCPLKWSGLWSLTRQTTRYLPMQYCWYAYPIVEREPRFCYADSNGCAAGNTLSEAILSGLFELIERDAVAIWWYNRMPCPGLDLDAFPDPYIPALLHHYHGLGRQVWALDLTHDLGIPVVAAFSRNNENKEEILMGFAAHSDPGTAVVKALTEMNLLLPFITMPNRTPKGPPLMGNPILREWLATAAVGQHPYLLPQGSAKLSSPAEEGLDTVAQLMAMVDRLTAKGLETLVLDQTRPEIGLPVVRVVVPGLRTMWNRFAPGRLYRVPLDLGRIENPLPEAALNPIPMFL